MPRNSVYLRLVLGAVCALALVVAFGPSPVWPAASAQVAPRWEKQSPMPSGATFEDVEMISATEGWVASAQGIHHTADGGRTWEWLTAASANRVYFKDALHGLAASTDILYTTDGGRTWNRGAGSPPSVGSFACSDLNYCLAAYNSTYVHRTTDGGRNWQMISLPLVVANVRFFDAQNGVASGMNGVLRTSDGGQTWTDVPHRYREHNRYQFYGVHFVNATTGWVVGDVGIILKTTDGGATWADQSLPTAFVPTPEDLMDVSFSDPLNGWAVGYGGGVYRTTDGGSTWQRQDAGTAEAVLGVHALSPSTAWIVGYGAPGGGVARTADGGRTWQREFPQAGFPVIGNHPDSPSSFSTVYFVDAETGWAGGFDGIYRRRGAALPPTVNLTSPQAGSVAVARVDFYSGETLLGSDAAAPYQLLWANPPAGSHALTARASDASGAASTSPVVGINVNAPSAYSIGGRVTDGLTGTGVGDVTVSLTGSAAATTVTNAIGEYVFANLPAGGHYAVTPSHAALDFTPASKTFNSLSASQSHDFKAYRQPLPAGSVVISEYRLDGPGGPADEFVEIYNNTNSPVTVSTADGSAGWALVRGTTLEQPPAQSLGGGFNSTLAAGIVSLATPLATGNSVNVGFVLGVAQPGNFRFLINVEAALDTSSPTPGKAAGGRQRDGGKTPR
ncbi:MAG: carboxypeptidase regulatory-like domain-containing protein [Acidobacteria bacterium]|nr:carboxypeptidase regulatory-like domain-containing protein [Acidobacteriota bacterium]